jgi:hypothetical protein
MARVSNGAAGLEIAAMRERFGMSALWKVMNSRRLIAARNA